MHQGEIRNLQTRLFRAVEELEERRRVSVSYEPVAYGVIKLVGHEDMDTPMVKGVSEEVR